MRYAGLVILFIKYAAQYPSSMSRSKLSWSSLWRCSPTPASASLSNTMNPPSRETLSGVLNTKFAQLHVTAHLTAAAALCDGAPLAARSPVVLIITADTCQRFCPVLLYNYPPAGCSFFCAGVDRLQPHSSPPAARPRNPRPHPGLLSLLLLGRVLGLGYGEQIVGEPARLAIRPLQLCRSDLPSWRPSLPRLVWPGLPGLPALLLTHCFLSELKTKAILCRVGLSRVLIAGTKRDGGRVLER